MVLFVSFLIYAVADRISMKHRNTAITPNRQNGSLTGDFAAIAGGTLAYLVLVLFAHNWLFGVAPLPGFGFKVPK